MAERPTYVLWAEAIREIGILLVVFVPLEFLLRHGSISREDWAISIIFLVVGLILIQIGVVIGRDA